mmetsp:Transcript_89216/g.213017  ORF Transcript_89216/g.213017 Transcript_89216/m.213017 type:complete len:662 (+) Transcript_89216:1325-3310(+)
MHLQDGGQRLLPKPRERLLDNPELRIAAYALRPVQVHCCEVRHVVFQHVCVHVRANADLRQLTHLVLGLKRCQLLPRRVLLNDVPHSIDDAADEPAGREAAAEGPRAGVGVGAHLMLSCGRLREGTDGLILQASTQRRQQGGCRELQPILPLVGRVQQLQAGVAIQVRQQRRQQGAHQHHHPPMQGGPEGARQGQLLRSRGNGSEPVLVIANRSLSRVLVVLRRVAKDVKHPLPHHTNKLGILDVLQHQLNLLLQISGAARVRVHEPGQRGAEAASQQLGELQALHHVDEGHVEHGPQRWHGAQVRRGLHGVEEHRAPLRVEVEAELPVVASLQVHHENHKHGALGAGALLQEAVACLFAYEAAVLNHPHGSGHGVRMNDQEILVIRGIGQAVEVVHCLLDVGSTGELMERHLLACHQALHLLQLHPDLAADGAVGHHHGLAAIVIAPKVLVLHSHLRKRRQIRVPLLLEVLADNVKAKLHLHLSRLQSRRSDANRFRCQNPGDHTLGNLHKFLQRPAGVGLPQGENQGAQQLGVVACNGPMRARAQHRVRLIQRTFLLGPIFLESLARIHKLIQHIPELADPRQQGLVRLGHEVLSQEDLLFEAVQQRSGKPEIGITQLGDHDHPEELVDWALLGLRAVRNANVALARVFHVVLVQKVVK